MRIHTAVCLFSRFFLLIIGLHCYPSSLYEGSECFNNNNSKGTCHLINNCPVAKESLLRHHYHNLKRCGFQQFDEIVCCPNNNNNNNNNNDSNENNIDSTTVSNKAQSRGRNDIRKADAACEKFTSESTILIDFHIVDGEDAEIGEFPHMGVLGYPTDDSRVIQFKCGGSLISHRYVLTAAHCIINVERNPPILVRFGVVNVPEKTNKLIESDYNITNITVHPDYKRSEKINDLALLKLNRNIRTTRFIHPACLYTKDEDPVGLIASGWGITEFGGKWSPILQKAQLTPVPLNVCNSTLLPLTQKILIRGQICAADNTSDTCKGDSGGPLQIQRPGKNIYNIVGITSYGIGCGNTNPSVYTRVYHYLDWIENIVWP